MDRVRADWQDLADALTPRTQAFVDGAFRDARSGRTEPTIAPATGQVIAGDIAAQTERVFENLKAVLAAAGATLATVVKTTVFLTDLANFAAMNAVYAKYFTEPFPARSTIQVAGLPRGASVEIEVTAAAE